MSPRYWRLDEFRIASALWSAGLCQGCIVKAMAAQTGIARTVQAFAKQRKRNPDVFPPRLHKSRNLTPNRKAA